jgi:hypothetical protein
MIENQNICGQQPVGLWVHIQLYVCAPTRWGGNVSNNPYTTFYQPIRRVSASQKILRYLFSRNTIRH